MSEATQHVAPMQMLLRAAIALRDLHMGWPHREIAAGAGLGLDTLLQEVTSYLRSNGVDDHGALDCEGSAAIPLASQAPDSFNAAALEELKRVGLTLTACIEAFAATPDDPYVQAARKLVLGDLECQIGEPTAIAKTEDGAWVLTWLRVSDEEAGVRKHADVLEIVHQCASRALSRATDMPDEIKQLRRVQADWLEDLLMNHADELDEIESEVVNGTPDAIEWQDIDGTMYRFMPSDALFWLLQLAKLAGMANEVADEAAEFCRRFGNKLDAILTVVQTH